MRHGSAGTTSLVTGPENARLLASFLPLLQAVYRQEELGRLDPLVEKLHELAPERVYTYQRRAAQELRRGNYVEALRIVEEFEAKAPWAKGQLQGTRRAAEEGLLN